MLGIMVLLGVRSWVLACYAGVIFHLVLQILTLFAVLLQTWPAIARPDNFTICSPLISDSPWEQTLSDWEVWQFYWEISLRGWRPSRWYQVNNNRSSAARLCGWSPVGGNITNHRQPGYTNICLNLTEILLMFQFFWQKLKWIQPTNILTE